jgi:hypothetical protein
MKTELVSITTLYPCRLFNCDLVNNIDKHGFFSIISETVKATISHATVALPLERGIAPSPNYYNHLKSSKPISKSQAALRAFWQRSNR